MDKNTSKLTLEYELKWKVEKFPVLEGVRDLSIKYKVTEEQAKMLTNVFPQFSENELKEKGLKESLTYYVC